MFNTLIRCLLGNTDSQQEHDGNRQGHDLRTGDSRPPSAIGHHPTGGCPSNQNFRTLCQPFGIGKSIPSDKVLRRLAQVLELDRRELIVLVYPGAKGLPRP
jgi:hypothetical protein